MREDNLLCIRRRSFTLTTDSNHTLAVYPNLARQIEPTGIDQLWIADMTYIRLRSEFVYLAIVLDAFSRRVIGETFAFPSRARIDRLSSARPRSFALYLRSV